jgi:choline dehydrogenase-like flavoprotein
MGSDPRQSVVDPNGKFHAVENLYAADASIFPSVGVANPMLTITAIAYHVANNVADGLARSTASSGVSAVHGLDVGEREMETI